MKIETEKTWIVQKLSKRDDTPYDLLLLADETIEAINQYIFACDLYIIEQGDNVIAVYALCSLNKNEMEIKNIAVDKSFQGQGIGRFLLQDAITRAKEKKCKTITIGTADTAEKQLHLYRSAGFEVYEVKKDFFTNNYPEPIFEDGIRLKDMVMLKKNIK